MSGIHSGATLRNGRANTLIRSGQHVCPECPSLPIRRTAKTTFGLRVKTACFPRTRPAGICSDPHSSPFVRRTMLPNHRAVDRENGAYERLIPWTDTYAQRLGSFNEDQEQRLQPLRYAWAALFKR